jgi:hypothetical protein
MDGPVNLAPMVSGLDTRADNNKQHRDGTFPKAEDLEVYSSVIVLTQHKPYINFCVQWGAWTSKAPVVILLFYLVFLYLSFFSLLPFPPT